MSRTRSFSARPTRLIVTLLALLLVAVGGIFFAAPADAASGVPVVIDDFSGGILGTRTVTPNGSASFSQANGVGTVVASSPGTDTGGVALNYALPSATDLTSHGNNTQFFLEFNSIEFAPADNVVESAAISIQLTDSSGHTGNYGTAIEAVAPFNIVLNFNCTINPVCFSGAVDFTRITNIQINVGMEGNDDSHRLTAAIDMIRTTPTGGAIPTPPTPNVTTASTSVASLNNTSVSFAIAYTIDGSPAGSDAAGLTASNIVVSGTAGGISGVALTGSAGNYTVTVGPLTSTGTVSVHVNAGAVTDGWGQGSDPSSNDPVVTFTKEVVPTISVAATATATVGTAFDLKSTIMGVPTPTVALGSGSLPSGLTLSSSGELSGTPARGSGGVYHPGFKATNAVGNMTAPLTLTVDAAPLFTSAAVTTFSEGAPGTFTVSTAAYPTAAVTEAVGSTLPSGVTFTANSDGTATITGTPAVGTNGTYTVGLVADNGIGTAPGQSLVITVTSAPVITTGVQDRIVAPGDLVTFTAAATSTPAPTVQWQRTNDGGTFVNISGATSTAYSFTAATTDSGHEYRAVFSNGVGIVTTTATLTVRLAPSFASSNSTTFVVGTLGSFPISVNGFPAPALYLTNAPGWLALQDNENGTGTLTGTPPASATGTTVVVTLTASNGVTADAVQTFSILIDETPVVIEAPQDTVVTPGSIVTLRSAADGYPVPTVQWQVEPAGHSTFQNIVGATSVDYVFVAGLTDSGSQYRAVFTNSLNSATSSAAAVRVGTAPEITSADATTFDAGATHQFTLRTSGAPTASISGGSLPGFLSLRDNGDGTATLSGAPLPADAGIHAFTLAATNGFDPDAQQLFTLTVDTAPTFLSGDTTTFSVGDSGTFDLTTAEGWPTRTAISETGALPDGVSLTDNGDGTATLVGIPSAGAGGDYRITVTASAVGGDSLSTTQAFDLVVDEAPTITSDSGALFTVGNADTFLVETHAGFPTLAAIGEQGPLPAGLTFTDNGGGTATIGGTAATGTGGTYPLVLSAASDGGRGLGSTEDFTVTVLEAPTFLGSTIDVLDAGTSSSFTVITSAGYPVTTSLAASGALPAGISFVDNGNGTATLAGTPFVGSGGNYPITLSATAVGGPTQTESFVIVVRESPAFTSADSTTFQNGASDSFTVATSHDFPNATTLSEVGALPTGVTFVDNADGTATLSGTPAGPGTYSLTFTASNRAPVQIVQDFTLTVAIAPTLPSNEDASFVAGVTSSVTLVSTPGVPATTTISVVGTLPDGISLTDNGDGTATLGGSPTPDSAGSYQVAFSVGNAVSPDSDYPATITVSAAPPVTLPASVPTSVGDVNGVPGHSTQDEIITVTGTGFAPGAPLTVGIYSTPTHLADIVADNAGGFSARIAIPKLLGLHTVVVSGVDPTGNPMFLSSRTTITAKTDGLPVTGVEIGASLYLGFSLFALGVLALLFAVRRGVSARVPR
ncbi:MAG TPA: putative Ig domain-containing protein [Galbitalea sp.]|nr:putative Ig domain-containing protein [Galbitalea sp.]